MKKLLFSTGCYLICLVSVQAQVLYGVTTSGMNYGKGVIFKLTSATNTLTVEKSFTDAVFPEGSLVQAADGKLYGVSANGGFGNAGVIYSFDPSSSTYTVVKDFMVDQNGYLPITSLMLANNGKLYGTTSQGGTSDVGVMFSFDPLSGSYEKIKDFGGSVAGAHPGSLMQASDGKLYGMTAGSGLFGYGTIFSFDIATLSFSKLMDFDGTNGGSPLGSLVQAGNGTFYGMTQSGGNNYNGVIFSFEPSTSTYTVVKHLGAGTGATPMGSLIEASDGKLYGLTRTCGKYNRGTVISFDPTTSAFAKLIDFDGTNGSGPTGNLMQASDGKLYGMTEGGGAKNFGVIFSFDPASFNFRKLQDFQGYNGAYAGIGNALIEVAECTTAIVYYKDADGDGYGNPYRWKIARTQPPGYTTNNTDCDDHNNALHPTTYFRDADGDLLGDANVPTTVCCLTAPAGYVINNNDDDDHDKLQYKFSNYPNPFAGKSTIKYGLPFDSRVSIKVYDLAGRVVATLVDENKNTGIYKIDFNSRGSNKGILYYKIVATSKEQHFEQTNTMVQLR